MTVLFESNMRYETANKPTTNNTFKVAGNRHNTIE